MKNFVWSLILLALLMCLAAPTIQSYLDGKTRWRVDFAVQQVDKAKTDYYQANEDNPNALWSYEEADAEDRKQTLIDAGLISDKIALYVTDPGRFAEAPTGHTVREMDGVRHEQRSKLGTALASL